MGACVGAGGYRLYTPSSDGYGSQTGDTWVLSHRLIGVREPRQTGYDDAGNQTARTLASAPERGWTMVWDGENRLKRMERVRRNEGGDIVESRTIDFSYDPFGRRIGKQLTTLRKGKFGTLPSFSIASRSPKPRNGGGVPRFLSQTAATRGSRQRTPNTYSAPPAPPRKRIVSPCRNCLRN